MNVIIKLAKITGLSLTVLLYGCGVAHIKPGVQSPDLGNYNGIAVNDVKVYSLEPAAKGNAALQEKLKNWQSYSSEQLSNYVATSSFQRAADGQQESTLLLDLDVNVQYGNRALRWAVGFGAGKGGVLSTLTAKDARTGEIKFEAQADSDLSGGGAGGDIGAVLRKNIQTLIEHFRNTAEQPS